MVYPTEESLVSKLALYTGVFLFFSLEIEKRCFSTFVLAMFVFGVKELENLEINKHCFLQNSGRNHLWRIGQSLP